MPLEDPTTNRKERFYEPEISEGLRRNRQNREEGRGPQGQLKELYDKKTELENLEIVNTVRAMVMDKDQIMSFLAAMKDSKAEKPTTTQQEVTDND